MGCTMSTENKNTVGSVPTGSAGVSKFGTLTVLCNATQLGSNVIKNIAGNDIASGFDGEEISPRELHNIFSAKLSSYVNKGKSGGQQ